MRRRAKDHDRFDLGVPAGASPGADRVIVIGAGASGLAAARVLEEHGVEVVVLEGRDRIGGRTHTVDVGGARLDAGAAWIDGHVDNPLMRHADAAGLTTVRADYVDPLRVVAFDRQRSRWLGRLEGLRLVVAVARAGERLTTPDEGDHPHLGARIDAEVESRWGSADTERIRRVLLRIFFESSLADDSEILDADAATIGGAYRGREAVVVGGYGRLAEALADGLDVRLGEVVESVRYDGDGVVVTTADDRFAGSHVIVTVPLGVLQRGAIDFDPPLPENKKAVIDQMPMGRLEKILMRFPTPFWRSDPDRPQNIFHLADDTPCPMFFDLSRGAGAPTLAMLVPGHRSTDLVENPDAAVAETLGVLEGMFPGRYRPPTDVHTTSWQTDPFAGGSYATVRPGTTEQQYDDLAEPVGGRVLFAGEATNKHRQGYVDGAIASGVREARRILGRRADLTMNAGGDGSRPSSSVGVVSGER